MGRSTNAPVPMVAGWEPESREGWYGVGQLPVAMPRTLVPARFYLMRGNTRPCNKFGQNQLADIKEVMSCITGLRLKA